jgi:peptidoglycan/LPS O-acetylase OafA/YrhL
VKPTHIPSLDGLRGVAFLLVYFAHSGLDKIVPGGFGVTIFFFLSGYLITTILRLEGETTGDISLPYFYMRRAFRILPPMYVTLAIAYAIGATGLLPNPGNLFGLAAASFYFFNYTMLLHLPAGLPSGTGSVWSLMVEEHFYLIFPFVYRSLFRKGVEVSRIVKVLLGVCALVLVWRCILVFVIHTPLSTFPRWTYEASDTRFDEILFGCILALWNNPWTDDSPRFKRHQGKFALGGLIVLLLSLVIREPHFRETFRYTMQSIALYPIFFYCVASAGSWQARWLEWKPLKWLGWISYSMYLVHMTVLVLGNAFFPGHPLAVPIGCFFVSVLYSWLMRVWVELPFRGMRSALERRLANRRALTAA